MEDEKRVHLDQDVAVLSYFSLDRSLSEIPTPWLSKLTYDGNIIRNVL